MLLSFLSQNSQYVIQVPDGAEICVKLSWIPASVALTSILPMLGDFCLPHWLTFPRWVVSGCDFLALSNKNLRSHTHLQSALLNVTSGIAITQTVHQVVNGINGIGCW